MQVLAITWQPTTSISISIHILSYITFTPLIMRISKQFVQDFQCESKRALMAISAGPWDFFRSDFYLSNLKSFQSQKLRKPWPELVSKWKKSIWSNFDARCLIFDLLQNPSSRQTYDRPMPIKCFQFWRRLSAFSRIFVDLGDIFPNSWKIATLQVQPPLFYGNFLPTAMKQVSARYKKSLLL